MCKDIVEQSRHPEVSRDLLHWHFAIGCRSLAVLGMRNSVAGEVSLFQAMPSSRGNEGSPCIRNVPLAGCPSLRSG